ncbi:unnamed protein product [Ectocarpus sp. 12 AP-2014]
MGFLNSLAGMVAMVMVAFSHARTAKNVSLDLLPWNPLPVILPQAVCADLVAWVPPQSDPAIVMQVVSGPYVNVESNFIYWMERKTSFTRNHLYLLCLDDDSRHFIESSMGIRCLPLSAFNISQNRQIWILRVRVVSCLVRAGYDVIMSDADALWLADPMKDFSLPGVVDSSIVAARGMYPFDLAKAWGVTICMGFVLFRGTASRTAMGKFLSVMNALVLESMDDQIAVNMAARALGIVWDEEGSDMLYEESTGLGVATIDSLTDEDNRLFTVTLLPHSTYTRMCNRTPVSNTTVVAHCMSKKTPGCKRDWMHSMDLWSVDEDTR